MSHVWNEIGSFWHCQTSGAPGEAPKTVTIRVRLGPVYGPTDSAAAMSACRAKYAQTTHVELFSSTVSGWGCWYIVGQTVRFGSGGSGSGAQDYFRDIPNLPLSGLKLRAFDGPDSGIQFRRLTQFYIGVQSVLDMGVLDAVDVWGNTGSGYEACFPGPGRVIFLDAATSPRTVVNLEHSVQGEYTCATSGRAGTMVLVKPDEDAPTQTTRPVVTRRPGTNDSVDTAISLQDCSITPRFNLRLRAAPWGGIRGIVPVGASVAATARTKSWFKISYQDQSGWSAAWLANSQGNCDWTAETQGEEDETA